MAIQVELSGVDFVVILLQQAITKTKQKSHQKLKTWPQVIHMGPIRGSSGAHMGRNCNPIGTIWGPFYRRSVTACRQPRQAITKNKIKIPRKLENMASSNPYVVHLGSYLLEQELYYLKKELNTLLHIRYSS